MSAKSSYHSYTYEKKGKLIKVAGKRRGRSRAMNLLSLRVSPDLPPFYKTIGSHKGTTKAHAEGMKPARDRHEISEKLIPTFNSCDKEEVVSGVVSK